MAFLPRVLVVDDNNDLRGIIAEVQTGAAAGPPEPIRALSVHPVELGRPGLARALHATALRAVAKVPWLA
jgi:hypothetical protein